MSLRRIYVTGIHFRDFVGEAVSTTPDSGLSSFERINVIIYWLSVTEHHKRG